MMCAVPRVYRGSPECYTAFITPEAHRALQECGRDTYGELMGRRCGRPRSCSRSESGGWRRRPVCTMRVANG